MAYPDFEEFIGALNARRVRYLIIGAHAVAFHARPRATKDLDIFVDPTPANAKRLRAALHDFFGGAPPGYADSDVLDRDAILQLGVAPVRIDILSSVDGIPSFASAWRRRVEGQFGAAKAHYLSLDDLVLAKTAAGREQDLADLVSLRRARGRSHR
jgi:predicted nucleotidyltransferase